MIRPLVALLALGLSCGGIAQAAGVSDPLDRSALPVRDLSRLVLLGAATAGKRLVAVGERGCVVLSDDDGRTWRQARDVPVSVTLTAVRFVGGRRGWAIGHGGVVLHSEDAGETWTRQLDGIAAGRLAWQRAEAEARRPGVDDAIAQRRLKDAKLLVDDGADKPFLDVDFSDDRHGIAVGAFGLLYATADGGATWYSWTDRADNPKALHLYALRRTANAIVIAGEQGLLLKSTDDGLSFRRLPTPYQGSWFALARSADGSLIVAGLRGNAYRSTDDGDSWVRLAGTGPATFVAATAAGTRVVLVDQAGGIFTLAPGETKVVAIDLPRMPPVTGLLPLSTDEVLMLTVQGARRVSLERRADGASAPTSR